MIIFDNMYYLLYTYFKRTNSGKWGYKGTALSIASLYFAFSILLLLVLIKIFYYFTLADLSTTTPQLQKNEFWWYNDLFFYVVATITFVVMEIRYKYFMKYEIIHEIKSNMQFRKRRILDDLTIIYLIIVPFLAYLIADFANELYQ